MYCFSLVVCLFNPIEVSMKETKKFIFCQNFPKLKLFKLQIIVADSIALLWLCLSGFGIETTEPSALPIKTLLILIDIVVH